MSKWSDIRVMNFLEIYEKHECLWNPKIESYKNKMAREAAFETILKELNMPGLTANDIKLKIKSIRTTYKRELTSILKSGKGESGSTYIPKLFWFKKADSFLREVSLARRSCTKMDCTLEGQKPDVIGSMMISVEQNYKPESNEDCENSTHEQQLDDEHQQIICNGYNTEELTEEVPPPPSYRMDTCENTPVHCPPQQANNCYRSSDEDEYLIFCRSVAAQLRAVPDSYSRSVAKFKIQQILFEAETGHYRKSAYITVPATQQISNL